jgi:hypothetical protein
MYYGVYSGRVVNTVDPSQAGRVQISVPAVQAAASSWAAVCLPPGTKGAFKVGQAAWVMFEGGNVSFPVVMGVKS